jgi:transcriptional regulator with XRE-family HTH domain
MVLAIKLAEELKRDGISRAELARRHGLSRARVTQWLSLLELPRLEIERVLAMGDYWERRLVTERGLRKSGQSRMEARDNTSPRPSSGRVKGSS